MQLFRRSTLGIARAKLTRHQLVDFDRLQVVLLLLALVCVPWLLIVKPYVVWKEMKRIHSQGYTGLSNTAREELDEVLEMEEEGNGKVLVQDADDEHVNFSSPDSRWDSAYISLVLQEQHDFGEVVIHVSAAFGAQPRSIKASSTAAPT